MSRHHRILSVVLVRDAGRLTQLAIAFLAAGLALALVQLGVSGTVTTPALGLGAIGLLLLPAGLLASLSWTGEDPSADGEDGDGGGGARPELEPLPPSGGLEIDWERFEAEFAAYAEALTPV